jgi:hypothetical protein
VGLALCCGVGSALVGAMTYLFLLPLGYGLFRVLPPVKRVR